MILYSVAELNYTGETGDCGVSNKKLYHLLGTNLIEHEIRTNAD